LLLADELIQFLECFADNTQQNLEGFHIRYNVAFEIVDKLAAMHNTTAVGFIPCFASFFRERDLRLWYRYRLWWRWHGRE
jgi:hypothetical protein